MKKEALLIVLIGLLFISGCQSYFNDVRGVGFRDEIFDPSVSDASGIAALPGEDGNPLGYIVVFKEKSLVDVQNELEDAHSEALSQGRAKPVALDIQKEETVAEQNERIARLQMRLWQDLGLPAQKPADEGGVFLAEYRLLFPGVALHIDAETAEQLQEKPYIESVTPERMFYLDLADARKLTNVEKVHLLNARKLACAGEDCLTGKGVVIAVLDTGVNFEHPDLGGCSVEEFSEGQCKKVVGGDHFVTVKSEDIRDVQGHGTHVAGIIAGTGKASNGMYKGVAPDAQILSYGVCGSSGGCPEHAILEGIERAMDPNQDGDVSDHADVMSLSLGGEGNPDDVLSRAVDTAVRAGIVAVIAAGNDGEFGDETINSPGTARKVITVGASTQREGSKDSGGPDKLAFYSSRGPVIFADEVIHKPDILAPGGDVQEDDGKQRYAYGIVSAYHYFNDPEGCIIEREKCYDPYFKVGDEYIKLSGTSMATPFVSGVVALMKQAHPDWTPEEIKAVLKSTAVDLGYYIDEQGGGRVNAFAAVQVDEPPAISVVDVDKKIHGVASVRGEISGRGFDRYTLELVQNLNGKEQKVLLTERRYIPQYFLLRDWDTGAYADGKYMLRLTVYRSDGRKQVVDAPLEIRNVEIVFPGNGELRGASFTLKGKIYSREYSQYELAYYTGEYWRKIAFVTKPDVWENIVQLDAAWDISLATHEPVHIRLIAKNLAGFYSQANLSLFFESRLKQGWPFGVAHAQGMTIADVDGNGRRDVVLVAGDQLSVFTMDGKLLRSCGGKSARWPVTLGKDHVSLPTVADLEGDGESEIIVAHEYGFEGYRCNGEKFMFKQNYYRGKSRNAVAVVADLDHDGYQEILVPYDSGIGIVSRYWRKNLLLGGSGAVHSPAVADMDGDGNLEIVVTQSVDREKGNLYIMNLSGEIFKTSVTSTRIPSDEDFLDTGNYLGELSPPIIADVDSDGSTEILFKSAGGSFFAYTFHGKPLLGWSQHLALEKYSDTLNVADIDSDGMLEMLTLQNKGDVYALNRKGVIQGWPASLQSKKWYVSKPLLVADLDRDGNQEVIAGNEDKVMVFDAHGKRLLEKEIYIPGERVIALELTDLEHDDKLDLIVLTQKKAYAFDFGHYGFVDWKSFQHDAARTGRYTLRGDYNANGCLDEKDKAVFDGYVSGGDLRADMQGDKRVDENDVNAFAQLRTLYSCFAVKPREIPENTYQLNRGRFMGLANAFGRFILALTDVGSGGGSGFTVGEEFSLLENETLEFKGGVLSPVHVVYDRKNPRESSVQFSYQAGKQREIEFVLNPGGSWEISLKRMKLPLSVTLLEVYPNKSIFISLGRSFYLQESESLALRGFLFTLQGAFNNEDAREKSYAVFQATPVNCYDDGFYNFFERDSVRVGEEAHTDYCKDGKLIEYACTNGILEAAQFGCFEDEGGFVCKEGACVEQEREGAFTELVLRREYDISTEDLKHKIGILLQSNRKNLQLNFPSLSSVATSAVWLLAVNKSHLAAYYEDKNGEVALAGNIPVGEGFDVVQILSEKTNMRVLYQGFNNPLFINISREHEIVHSFWSTDRDGEVFALGEMQAFEEKEEVLYINETGILGIGDYKQDYVTPGGIIIAKPRAHGASDEVEMLLPLKAALPGDYNGDGCVGQSDADLFMMYYQSANSEEQKKADLDGDGEVTPEDFFVIANAFSADCK